MAGSAFLPWEQWIAQLLHPVYVAIRRSLAKKGRRHDLDESRNWPEAKGTIHSKKWDSSLPREELLYSFSTPQGYFSGSSWLWFERSELREVKVGDRVALRYDPDCPEKSILVRFV